MRLKIKNQGTYRLHARNKNGPRFNLGPQIAIMEKGHYSGTSSYGLLMVRRPNRRNSSTLSESAIW